MAEARVTITLGEHVLQAVLAKAARSGQRDSDVIEEALRRELGLDLPAEDAFRLAVEAQHEARRT